MNLVQSIDHVALLPAYLAAATALLAFLVDLIVPGRPIPVLAAAAVGTAATGVAAWVIGAGPDRATFCIGGGTLPGEIAVERSCSFSADGTGAVIAVVLCGLTLLVLALSVPAVSGPTGIPAGEYCFLLAASLTGGVVLGYARDLITLLVALETLTLPLYVLTGLRRRSLASAEGAVTFLVVSVVSTAVTLMGVALLYALTGAVHLDRLAVALEARDDLRQIPLTAVAAVMVVAGLAFKIAAVPFHAWAPTAYDGAPLPVAAYLSTASKLGGVVAILLVVIGGLWPWLNVTGPVLAGVAVLTMTVGNLVALQQRRMVRLLAWSSVAQAGYLIAPLGAFATAAGREDPRTAVAATVAYTIFFVLLEVAAFGAVIAARGAADGGWLTDYRGIARRHPWVATVLVLALAGLAGLPPGLAGLFAKITVIRALLVNQAGWLAVIVALNAVIGLVYYLRVGVLLFQRAPDQATATVGASTTGDATPAPAPGAGEAPTPARPAPAGQAPWRSRAVGSDAVAWPVGAALAAITLVGVGVGFAPQTVLDAAGTALAFLS